MRYVSQTGQRATPTAMITHVAKHLYPTRPRFRVHSTVAPRECGIGQYPDPLLPIEHRRWSPDMSAPQHIGVGAQTGRISSAGEQTCRLPSKLPLGSRQVGYIWRWGADLSAPQHIGVGEPTGRFPRKLPLRARHVGSLDTAKCVTCRGLHILT